MRKRFVLGEERGGGNIDLHEEVRGGQSHIRINNSCIPAQGREPFPSIYVFAMEGEGGC